MATGVQLSHIARQTSDVNRLSDFYQEVLGFERMETPNFGNFQVVWLRLPPPANLALHLIERDTAAAYPPAEPATADPEALPRGHHVALSVTDFDGFLEKLKERKVRTFQTQQPNGKTRQVFFFDPDGNGLEVQSREDP